jgi:hypothetical protein
MTILKRSWAVMIKQTLISLALMSGCAIALAAPAAQAQIIDTQGQLRTMAPRLKTGDHVQWMASSDKAQSGQYERLLRTDPAFRQTGMQKECGPITDPVLLASCEDSFSAWQDEPFLGWHERMTGGSTGTMNSTGTMPKGPDIYDNGAGR